LLANEIVLEALAAHFLVSEFQSETTLSRYFACPCVDLTPAGRQNRVIKTNYEIIGDNANARFIVVLNPAWLDGFNHDVLTCGRRESPFSSLSSSACRRISQ